MITGRRAGWVVAGVAAVAVIALILDRGGSDGSDQSGAAGDPGGSAAAEAGATTGTDRPAPAGRDPNTAAGGDGPFPGDGPDDDPAVIAARAVAAWQIQDATDRTAALAPLVTEEWLDLSMTIDPALVPTAGVRESRVRVDSDGAALVDVELADRTGLAVMLTTVDARWAVTEILPTTTGAAALADRRS